MAKMRWFIIALFLSVTPWVATAQTTPPAPTYTQAQLGQMLAPIALYPDPLVGQILMASTYPLEVVQADRWRQDPQNAALQGDQLSAALQQQTWDPSVKSLVPFPQVLKMMDNNLQWTEQLGDAFLAQQPAVMDTVQQLRAQAQAAGTLQSTPQQTVSTQGQDILIEPANPAVVYVPYYDPSAVYGTWPYPAYPPFYFPAPLGFAYNGAFIGFGIGFGIIAPFWGWDTWDWHHHHLDIDHDRFSRINNGHPPIGSGGTWHHDPDHRHGVPYHSAGVRAQYQHASEDARRSYRGYSAAAAPQAEHNNVAARGITNNAVRPNAEAYAGRQRASAHAPVTVSRGAQEPRPQHSSPLFESFSHGSEASAHATRGAASRSAPAPSFSRGGGSGGGHGGNERR